MALVLLQRRDQRLHVVADHLVAEDQLAIIVAQRRAVPQLASVVEMEEQRPTADERLVVALEVARQPLGELMEQLALAACPLDKRARGDRRLERERGLCHDAYRILSGGE